MLLRQFNWALVSAVILFALCAVASANAPSASSFTSAKFTGVYLDQVFQDDLLSYTLTLAPNATVNGLAIDWVQGFYAIGDGSSYFTATAPKTYGKSGDPSGWSWGSSGSSKKSGNLIKVAGWSGDANKLRLFVSSNGLVSKTFTFGSLDIPTNASVLLGLHIGYTSCSGRIKTAYFVGAPATQSPVPEPGTILAACSILAPAGFVFRRKRA